MRETANLSLGSAAKCLGIGGLELRLLEQRGRGITDEMLAAVRTVYRQNARNPAAEPINEYVPGVPEQESCQHFWQIERPDGPTSRGRCIGCGSEKDFHNSGNFGERGPGD